MLSYFMMNFENNRIAMKKIQLKIIAASLLLSVMLWGASCNRCSNSNTTTTETTETNTDTVYSSDSEGTRGTYDAGNDNAANNASGGGNTSGAGINRSNEANANTGTGKDTVKKVPSGGSTNKEVRFSASGNN